MPFTYNGKEVEKVTYNGKEVQKIEYNGTTVWEAGHWYPVQIEILTSPEYTYENVAPTTINFDAVTDNIFSFQQTSTSVMYNRTSPKKYKMSGTLTYINSGSTKTHNFTDAIIDPAKNGGVLTYFDGAELQLIISSAGTVYIGTTKVSTTLYATKLYISSFEEYR